MYAKRGKIRKDLLVSWLSALLPFKSHNSGIFHPNEKNKIQSQSLGLLYPKQKHFKIRTKGFCSIVDQTQDLFWGIRYVELKFKTATFCEQITELSSNPQRLHYVTFTSHKRRSSLRDQGTQMTLIN